MSQKTLNMSFCLCLFLTSVLAQTSQRFCFNSPPSASVTKGKSLFLYNFSELFYYTGHKYEFLHLLLNSLLCKTLKKGIHFGTASIPSAFQA